MKHQKQMVDLVIVLAVITFLFWCIYPAVTCDETVVRGVFRFICINGSEE